MKIAALMAGGFEETEALAVIDLLKRAGGDVDLYSLEGSELTSSHGISFTGFRKAGELDKESYDLLYLPGGKKNFEVLDTDPRVRGLAEYFLKEKRLAAICAAPAALGHLGLLRGRRYTCYTSFNEASFGGTYLNQYWVKDGNLYTGRSLAASIEFGLLLVGELFGPEAREQTKQKIIY